MSCGKASQSYQLLWGDQKKIRDKGKRLTHHLYTDKGCTLVGDKVILRCEIADLAVFDLVPPLNEVLHNVKNNGTIDGHVHLNLCVSFLQEEERSTDVHRATAYGENPAQKSFHSRNCSRPGSPLCARYCNTVRERGRARNRLGAHRQWDDSGCPSDRCPSDQNK